MGLKLGPEMLLAVAAEAAPQNTAVEGRENEMLAGKAWFAPLRRMVYLAAVGVVFPGVEG